MSEDIYYSLLLKLMYSSTEYLPARWILSLPTVQVASVLTISVFCNRGADCLQIALIPLTNRAPDPDSAAAALSYEQPAYLDKHT